MRKRGRVQLWSWILTGIWTGILTGIVSVAVISAPAWSQEPPETQLTTKPIADIIIVGLERMDPGRVLLAFPIKIGDTLSQESLNDAIKALYATNWFRDIRFTLNDDELTLQVEENNTVTSIDFEGATEISEDLLRQQLVTKVDAPLSQATLAKDIKALRSVYQISGYFSVQIQTRTDVSADGTVALTFVINERERSRITSIKFSGNQFFSDSELRAQLLSAQDSPITQNYAKVSWTQERLNADALQLRLFYRENGFLEATVQTAVTEIAQSSSRMRSQFLVTENTRYRFGDVSLENQLLGVDTSEITKQIDRISEGDWVKLSTLDALRADLRDIIANQGFAFYDVAYNVSPEPQTDRASVRWFIQPIRPVKVERVEIANNTVTRDYVIRRNIRLYPGSVFTQELLRASQSAIQRLGFFENVETQVVPGRKPDTVVVTFSVTERKTGSINLGVNYSTLSGPGLVLKYSERNFLGWGHQIDLDSELQEKQIEGNLTYSNPAWRDSHIFYRLGLSGRDRRLETYAYDSRSFNVFFSTGFYFFDNWSFSIGGSYGMTDIYNVKETAQLSPYVTATVGVRNDRSLTTTVQRDTRNDLYSPTRGTRTSVSITYAGFGGDSDYVRLTNLNQIYIPIFSPLTLRLSQRNAILRSVQKPLTVTDRFQVGYSTFRGFGFGGVGPRDTANNVSLGAENYFIAQAELVYALGDLISIPASVFAFSDIGFVFGIGEIENPSAPIADSQLPRASVGWGIEFASPLGPIRFEFSYPQLYQSFDNTLNFRFTIGQLI